MKRHGSLNRVYRLVWSQILNTWVAVAENVKARGKSISGRGQITAVLLLLTPMAFAAPTGGQITAGEGNIAQAGTNTTITQQSQKLAIDWLNFSVAPDEAVRFNQPSTAAIALNRILGPDASQILGSMTANGQVFILNPNGVLFGQGAQVNVGGLVVSTLNLSNADFLAGNYAFSNNGATGIVVNQGNLTAANRGYIALLGNNVSNQGVIIATLGTALLAAGNKVTLTLNNGSLLGYSIDQGALKALAENKQLVQADGGLVIMTAKAADALSTAVVNNIGIIEAQTVRNQGGVIKLLGDMQAGQVNVGGTLDASAPNGGDGGFIETSAAQVKVADAAQITTAAPQGTTGTWLIDPPDFTIGAGGDITGATLSANLATTSVTISSTLGTVNSAGNGDIFVNDAVTWNSDNSLTLTAIRNIDVNEAITSTGLGSVNLRADSAGACVAGASNCGTVNFAGPGHVTAAVTNLYYNSTGSNAAADTNGVGPTYATPTDYSANVTGALNAYMLVNDVAQLQAMNTNLGGLYAQGRDIDATMTSTWNGGEGFVPVGNDLTPFYGQFDGLNHTVTNLTINRPWQDYVGLFGYIDSGSVVQNVALLGANVTGNDGVGGLAGLNYGSLSNVIVNGNVAGNSNIGEVAGINWGSIDTASASGSVNGNMGSMDVGGLVGLNYGEITNASASAIVSGSYYLGGLVGDNWGDISNANAAGSVAGISNTDSAYVGGLVGSNDGNIDNSHADASVTGTYYVGGLVGDNWSIVSNAYATGNVTGLDSVGDPIDFGMTGGLVGVNDGSISKSYATGSVTGSSTGSAGGLAGHNFGTIDNSYAAGSVDGSYASGGLVGVNFGSIDDVYATGSVVGSYAAGGLVGYNDAGSSISNAYATGSVTGAVGSFVGGVTGENWGAVSNVYWDVDTTGVVNGDGAGNSLGAIGLTTAEMMQAASFGGFDFANTWYNIDGSTRPFLRSEYGTTINNAHQLQLMAMDLGASYTLAQNISMSELANPSGMWNSATGFAPVGNAATPYSGTFDGNGRVIDGLMIYRPATDQVGLFGGISHTAIIRNVGLTNENITGRSYVGGLVGYNNGGAVSNVYGTGSVTGQSQVGGLVGYAGAYWLTSGYSNPYFVSQGYWQTYSYHCGWFSTCTGSYWVDTSYWTTVWVDTSHYVYPSINNSYADTTVSGYIAGGLAGVNAGSITNSYSTGAVSGSYNVGGLVGQQVGGSISNAYSTGRVSGTGFLGGLLGSNSGAVSASYWDIQASGQVLGVGTGSVAGVTGLNTVQMMQQGNFGGWDFANTWRIYDGYTNPLLKSFLTPLTITADNVSQTYNGLTWSAPLQNVVYSVAGAETSGHLFNVNTPYGSVSGKNVGSYTPALYSDQQGYDITYVGGALTVNPAALAVTAIGAAKTYDGLAYNGGNGVSYTGFVNGETATVLGGTLNYSGSAQGAVNVGSYVITPGGLSSGNYTISYVDNTLTVDPAALTVTANAASKVYDGLVYSGGNGVTYAGFVNGENPAVLGGALNYGGSAQGAVNAGSYLISPNGLSSGNYSINYVDNTLTIDPAALTVTANAAAKVYDGLAYNGGNGVTYTGFVNGETSAALGGTLNYDGSAQGAVNAGSYVITPGGLSSGNYTISYVDNTLTVDPAALTVMANAAAKTYDGLVYAGGNGVTYSGFVNGETAAVLNGALAYGGSAQGAVNVGSYVITPGGLSSGNYTISYVDNTLTVDPAALTVTANAASKVYDGLVYSGSNGVTYSGFVNGETSVVLGGTLNYSGSAQGAVNAGSYLISPSGLTSGNYTISYVDGGLTVNPAALTVMANAAAKTYDGLAYAGGNGVTYSGFVNGETVAVLGGALAYGGNSQGAVNAGSYQISPNGLSSGNYTISYVDNTLTVDPAALTVTASAATKTYDGLAFNGGNGVTYAGFVNGENPAVLGGTLNYGGSAQGAVNAGSYVITPGGLSSGNYTISYVDNSLTVDPADLTVTANAAAKVYDGLAYNGGNGVTYTGFVNGETVAALGGTLNYGGSAQGAINAGSYIITPGGLSSGNYTISYVDNTLTVDPAALTVTASAASKVYDGLSYNGGNGVSYTGFVNGETAIVLGGALNYGGSAQGAVNAGNYLISPSGLTSDNYTISYVDGGLTVDPAALTVMANAAAKAYDGLAYAGGNGVTYSGFVNGETVAVLGGALDYGGSSQGAVNAGSYQISPNGLSSDNYTISYVDNTLTVDPVALTVTASAAAKTYDGLAFNGGNGVTYAGFVNGETAAVLNGALAYGGSSQGAVNAGSYLIFPDGLTSSNYAVSYVDGALTVAPATLIVAANPASKFYDGTAYNGGNGVAYSGFVNGETSAVLGGALNYGGSAQGAVNAGSYLISPSGLTSGNYTIGYVDGVLKIKPASQAVAALGGNILMLAYEGALHGIAREQTVVPGSSGAQNSGLISIVGCGVKLPAGAATADCQ